MTKGGNHVSNPPRTPAPPDGDDYLHTKGGGQGLPSPKVHREPHSAEVKTK